MRRSQSWLRGLEECCTMPVEEVPDLETILRSIPQSTVGAPQAAPSASDTARSCGISIFLATAG